jgi:hypothetical protein
MGNDCSRLCLHGCLTYSFSDRLVTSLRTAQLWYILAHLTRIECAYQLRDSGAKVVLAGPDQLANALEAAKQVGLASKNVFAFGDVDQDSGRASGPRSWTQIWVSQEEARSWHWRKINARKELEETTAIINYSSGYVVSPVCCGKSAELF